MKPLLTIQDIQKIFKISRRTVYHWINKAILAPIHIGGVLRFKPEDIETLVEKVHTPDSKKKILVIDDDFLVLHSLKQLLQKNGFEVLAVSSGEEAIQAVQQQSFDLVISDFRMPQMDGVQALARIQQEALLIYQKSMPRIMLSAYVDSPLQAKAETIGVQTVIAKPFCLDEFLATVHTNLN
ncbi:MAG: hypothetical protein COV74_07055 [Candidatus Omnitrophica bacterium CG11_big_fil_rev_8_21_14_0_20_45_26]|uniref:Response regulatory domain-containing protein n=1 Tax=Candidatus Abzuiibacterium crystallinum TaxID=1974748 RepID=A0A2H0LNC8_9BACT|nr:MAG: hypothetical protein COV74_07055 [Candidatus Omnitrophica bacterium CG11_big_fil_rev_8_21_14_0_20_45_26]PIW63443.1 MAG: hypothetical protein COW12_10395 [Candidatus Omnitrophica bacterium CG12_big_fil_rev_8_21_14_0_65_45_16]